MLNIKNDHDGVIQQMNQNAADHAATMAELDRKSAQTATDAAQSEAAFKASMAKLQAAHQATMNKIRNSSKLDASDRSRVSQQAQRDHERHMRDLNTMKQHTTAKANLAKKVTQHRVPKVTKPGSDDDSVAKL